MDDLYRAIELLGDATVEERIDFLEAMLDSASPGCRSAAASALGRLMKHDMDRIQPMMLRRYHEEGNRMVRAVLIAHLHVVR
jgi:HEAT repeat protein